MTISVRMTPVKALADDKFKSLFDLYAAESGIESFGNWAVAWQNYEALENTGCFVVYVAYDDDTPVGIVGCLITLHLHYRVPMLATDGFFVLSEYRDKGVGGRLLASAYRLAKAKRIEHVEISCPPGGHLDRSLSVKPYFTLVSKIYERSFKWG